MPKLPTLPASEDRQDQQAGPPPPAAPPRDRAPGPPSGGSALGAAIRSDPLHFPPASGARSKLGRALSAAATVDPDEAARAQRLAIRRGVPQALVEAALRSGAVSDRAALEHDYDGLLGGMARTQRWLSRPENATVAHDDVEALVGLERALIGTRRERSWVGEIGSSTASGLLQLQASYFHLGVAMGLLTPEEAAEGAAAINGRILAAQAGRSASVQAYFQDLDEASGLGIVLQAFSDPAGLSVLLAENLAFSLPAIGLGTAGAAAGGPWGLAAGVGAGSAVAEAGAWINAALASAGYDTSDPADLTRAYRDQALMEKVVAQAGRMGLGVGTVDALSTFVGGNWLGKAKGLRQKSVGLAKELGFQAVGEGVGQATGTALATGEIDVDEAILESVAALGQSLFEIGAGTALRRGVRPALTRAAKAVQARQDAQAVEAAVPLWSESKLAQRLPERLRDLIQTQVEGQDQETIEARIDREAWDEHFLGQDEEPREALEALLPDGRRRYHDAANTGQVVVPLGTFIEGLATRPAMAGLLMKARFRADGLTLEEVEQQQFELEDEIEAVVEQAEVLYQEERDLREEAARLDEQIGGFHVEPDGETPPDLLAARKRRAEVAKRLDEIAAQQAQRQKDALGTFAETAEALTAAGAKGNPQALALLYLSMLESLVSSTGKSIPELRERFTINWFLGTLAGRRQRAAGAAVRGEPAATAPPAPPEAAPPPEAEPEEPAPVAEPLPEQPPKKGKLIPTRGPDGSVVWTTEPVDDEEPAPPPAVVADEDVQPDESPAPAPDEPATEEPALTPPPAAPPPAPDELAAWTAEQLEMGHTEEEVEQAIADAVEAGIDPTRSDDLASLEQYQGAVEKERVAATDRVARAIGLALEGPEPITWRELQKLAALAFGATQAEGGFTAQDLANAAELALNRFIVTKAPLHADFAETVRWIEALVDRLPTQTRRTGEKVAFQQFSTPQHYAAAAAWVANLRAGDVLLEPSAGTGNLATWGLLTNSKVIANEIDQVRALLLQRLGVREVYTEDAEQLDNILPDSVAPTVVLMNPPFSAAGNRGITRNLMTGARHIEQALARLPEGGRLVAIVGRGMAFDAPTFAGWWNRIREQHTVRANVEVAGKVYRKLGTTFATRLLVIDKGKGTAATVEPVTGSVDAVEALLPLLQEVRDGRPVVRRPSERGEPEGAPRPGPRAGAAPVGAPGDGAPVGDAGGPAPAGEPSVGGRPGDGDPRPAGDLEEGPRARPPRPGGAARPGAPADGAGVGPRPPGAPGEPSGEPAAGPAAAEDAPAPPPDVEPAPESAPVIAMAEQQAVEQAEDGAIFETYQPVVRAAAGSQPHPAELVQSAAMASVSFPPIQYEPKLPKAAAAGLSDAQLETVALAGQAHSKNLIESNVRRGVFIGDGTGVGKGREIAGIVMDSFSRGATKAVWITKDRKLYNDSVRDWLDLGGKKTEVLNLGYNVKASEHGPPKSFDKGVLFVTYGTLRSGAHFLPGGQMQPQKNKRARLDQIKAWLPPDFDGVIAFDEAHLMGNAITDERGGSRGRKEATATALAGLHLQAAFPRARVVYASATGATEVTNLAYAPRLGLWGKGTPFATVADFVSKIGAGGLAAMEYVARDLKQLGLYTARSISLRGVQYERMEHRLTPEQLAIYDRLGDAWRVVLQNMEAALNLTQAPGKERGYILSQFWSANQRFFDQILVSMQMPTLLKQVEAELADPNGPAVVMQLVNTQEAALVRAEARRGKKKDDADDGEGEYEDLDLSPVEMLINMVHKAFPVEQWETVVIDGVKVSQMVFDHAGNPVLNKEAVRQRDELIQDLQDLKAPLGPIDFIMQHLGEDKVAEVTGRTRRIIYKDGKQQVVSRNQERASAAAMADFQRDKKRVLVFSMSGGTGTSFHADLRAKNQRLRRHYIVQAGWQASPCIQGLGRTHRSNQKQPPEYILVSTDIPGHKRFLTSVARRIEQLGALTKGQRQAGAGVFTERDNLEGPYGNPAVRWLIEDVVANKVEGFTAQDLVDELGLTGIVDDKGKLNSTKVPPVAKFLNRLLSARVERQGQWFEAFAARMDALVEKAIADGNLDTGMQELKAKRITVDEDHLVRTDQETGAETRLLRLTVVKPRTLLSFDRLEKRNAEAKDFWVNVRSGNVWYAGKPTSQTTKAGEVRDVRRLHGPGGSGEAVLASELSKWSKTWRPVADLDEARALWERRYAQTPTETEEKVDLLTGLLLPLWDRLPEQGAIYRVRLDNGRSIIGREIKKQDLADTLRNLGVGGKAYTLDAGEAGRAVLAGQALRLSNGWMIRRVSVAGEPRIEVSGPTFAHRRELEEAGVFVEIIASQRRWFVPTGAGMERAMGAVLLGRDIVDVQGGDKETLLQTPREAAVSRGQQVQAAWAEYLEEIARTGEQPPRWVLEQIEDEPAAPRRPPSKEQEAAVEAGRQKVRAALDAWVAAGKPKSGIASVVAALDDFALAGPPRAEVRPSSRLARTGGGPAWDAFQERLTALAGERRETLRQEGGKRPKGSTAFGAPDPAGRRVFDVTFYKTADRSTFFHELGHVWLEVYGDIAGDADAPERIRDDYAEILRFLGVQQRAELTEEHKEKWARAFEAYIMEGRAPSARLRAAFNAFRTWLVRIYKTVAALGVELNDDIRAVMDRMVASDEEIAAARYEVGTAILPAEALAAMSEEDRVRYVAMAQAVQDEAAADVTRQVLQSHAEQVKAARDERMDEIRSEVAAEIEQTAAVQALQAMQAGRVERLDRATVKADHPEEAEALEALGVLADEGGITPAQAAEAFGARSGSDFVRALLQAARKDEWIERVARERLKARYPELMGTASIRATARRAQASEQRARMLAEQLRILEGLARSADTHALGEAASDAARAMEAGIRRRAFTPTEQEEAGAIQKLKEVREAAEAYLATLEIRQIQPHVYLSAARRESTRVANRVRVGAYQQAADAARRELYNLELYRIGTKLQERAARNAARARFMASAGTQARLGKAGHDYRDQVNKILDRFSFRVMTQKQERKVEATRAWLARLEAAGEPAPMLPPWLVEEVRRQHWRTLKPHELEEVRDALEQFYGLASVKNKLLAQARKRFIDEAKLEVVGAVESSRAPRRVRRGERQGTTTHILASHRAIDSYARQIDGHENGALTRYGVRPLFEAAAAETVEGVRINKELGRAYKLFTAEDRRAWTRPEPIEGVREALTLEQRICVALHYGNAEGRARLLNIFTADEIQRILGTLEQRHADIARIVWELEDSYWPAAKRLWEKLRGVAPPKVEALPFASTRADGTKVTWRGGYHRLKYEAHRRTEETLGLDEQQLKIRRGDALRGMTKTGSMIERLETVDLEPRLDFGVVTSHLAEVVHTITHMLPLRDVQAVMLSPEVRQALESRYGEAVYQQFRSAYNDVAAGTWHANDAMARGIGYLRAGVIVMRIGWRATTNLINLGGITQSMAHVGAGHVAHAMGRVLREPRQVLEIRRRIDAVSTFMANRNRTFQRELYEQTNRFRSLSRVDGLRSAITRSSFTLLAATQLAVDVPTWIAAFEKAGGDYASLRAGDPAVATDFADAIAVADAAVIASQGGGRHIDQAEILRGSEWKKLWTTFYGFSTRTLNVSAESFARVRKDPRSAAAYGRFAVEMALLYVLPAMWAVAIQRLLRGDDDDDTPLEDVVREASAYVLGQWVVLREFTGPALGIGDYSGPAGAGFVQEGARLWAQVGQQELDEGLARSVLSVAGIAAHLPTTQAWESAKGLHAWLSGDAPPTAVLIGPPRDED